MLKKLVLLVVFSFLLFSPVSAESPAEGHVCEGNQCLSCTLDEEGCQTGVCTAFLCEDEDKIPPVAPIVLNKEQLAQKQSGNSLRIRGYGEADTRVFVIINGQEKHEAAVNNEGDFDVSFNPEIREDGEYTIELYLKDQSGNKGKTSEKIKISVDATAPELKFLNVTEDSLFEKTLLSGTAEKGGKIEAYLDGKLVTQTGVDENGIFDLLLTLKEGENKFSIRGYDLLGNVSDTEVKINYEPSEDNDIVLTQEGNGIINIKFPVGIVLVQVFIDGELIENIKVENGEEEAEFDISDRVGGSFSHKFEFIGIDIAGNQTKTAEFNYSNTGGYILILLAVVLLLAITAFVVIQVRNGKLKLFGYRGTTQLKINLEEKEDKFEDEKPLITPRKEY